VWLAGRPELKVDGVDGYVYAGCDALAALRTVHEELGIDPGSGHNGHVGPAGSRDEEDRA
jgi:methylmalonyl-CoA mutase